MKKIGFGIPIFWLALLSALTLWWIRLLLQQAQTIHELRSKLGLETLASEELQRFRRMVLWESSSYLFFLLLSGVFLLLIHRRELIRAKGVQVFFASVTHELKTPIASIRLQTEAILDHIRDVSPDLKVLFSRLIQDTSRLENQVERTLELARLEGGGRVFLQPLRFRKWLENFIKSSNGILGLNQGEVVILPGGDQTWISADLAGLQIVFKNIFENAKKHANASHDFKIEIKIQDFKDHILVECKDFGGAVDLDRSQLGSLFVRGPRSNGTGVGLYLIKELSCKMGGSAEFESWEKGFLVKVSFQKVKTEDFGELTPKEFE